jgi:hypothetical protein
MDIASVKDRFLSKVVITDDGCWNWTAALMPGTGYGVFFMNKKNVYAHRVAWQLFKGEIAGGLFVLHDCDNKKCVNPEHLHLGTHKDNMREGVVRGRFPRGDAHNRRLHPECVPRGEAHWRARLSNADVAKIRQLYASGGWTCKTLGEEFGVTAEHIWGIITGKHRKAG